MTANTGDGDGRDIFVGLFVDGDRLAFSQVVDGKARIAAPVISGNAAYLAAWFADGEPDMASKKDLSLIPLPDDAWKPVAAEIENGIAVVFNTNVSFDAARKRATIDAAAVNNSNINSSANTITITGVTETAGKTLVIAGVKYLELFPSYVFTFTITVQ